MRTLDNPNLHNEQDLAEIARLRSLILQRRLKMTIETEKAKLDSTLSYFVGAMRAELHRKVDAGYVGWDTEGWRASMQNRLEKAASDAATDHTRAVAAANLAMFIWALGLKS